MLEQAYTKTEQGRAEIKSRALPLSRSLRNLLLVIDDSKSAQQWLGLVQGITAADIGFLIDQGLIAPSSRAGSAAGVAPAAPQAHALPSLDYQALYAYLTGAAREHLGLIKGYRGCWMWSAVATCRPCSSWPCALWMKCARLRAMRWRSRFASPWACSGHAAGGRGSPVWMAGLSLAGTPAGGLTW